MSEVLLLLSDRVSAWWGTLSERTQSVVCAVALIALIAAGRLDAAGQGADVAEVLARVLPTRADIAQANLPLLKLHVIPPSSTSRSGRSPRWRRRRR